MKPVIAKLAWYASFPPLQQSLSITTLITPMNKRKDIVPNNLKENRIRCGYTQKEVATMLGFATEDRICLWEKGKNIPNLINLLKLSSLYRATPMQLYAELMMQVDDEIEDRSTKSSIERVFPVLS